MNILIKINEDSKKWFYLIKYKIVFYKLILYYYKSIIIIGSNNFIFQINIIYRMKVNKFIKL